MCRLTAYVGTPLPVSNLVFGGTHTLFEQSWSPTELLSGSVNADGWGVAWHHGGRPHRLARAEPIWYAHELETLLGAFSAPLAVAAVRNATTGLPIGAEAVAPLTLGSRSFVLNGFVPSFRARHMRALRRPLPDHLYAELRGVSDTETLFLLVVDALDQGSAPEEALQRTADLVLSEVGKEEECQLTMVLADGESLSFVRTSNADRVNSLYRLDRGKLAPEGVLLASERLDHDDGWTPVPRGKVFELRPGPPPSLPDPSRAR